MLTINIAAFGLLVMIAVTALVQAPPIVSGNGLRAVQINDIALGG